MAKNYKQIWWTGAHSLKNNNNEITMIIVPPKILLADVKIVIFVQLPELTIYYIEMFIREEIGDLIDVIFFLQAPHSLEYFWQTRHVTTSRFQIKNQSRYSR